MWNRIVSFLNTDMSFVERINRIFHSDLTLQIIIPGILALGFGIYLLIHWLRNREKIAVVKATQTENKVKTEEEYSPVKVRLYDSIKHKIYNKMLGDAEQKYMVSLYGSLGRQWDFNGIKVYAINKYQNPGKETQEHVIRYRPVESVMEVTREHSPSRVHEAIYHPEIGVYWNMQLEQSTLQKLMPVILTGGLCLLGVLLLMNSK